MVLLLIMASYTATLPFPSHSCVSVLSKFLPVALLDATAAKAELEVLRFTLGFSFEEVDFLVQPGDP